MARKMETAPVHTYEGLSVHVTPKPAKTGKGKDRVWIQVRQDQPTKAWRQAEALIYKNGVDILFERSQ
jgi:hypothetical protein